MDQPQPMELIDEDEDFKNHMGVDMTRPHDHILYSFHLDNPMKYEPDPKVNENQAQAHERVEQLLKKHIRVGNTLDNEDGYSENDDWNDFLEKMRRRIDNDEFIPRPWPYKLLIGSNAEIWHVVG